MYILTLKKAYAFTGEHLEHIFSRVGPQQPGR